MFRKLTIALGAIAVVAVTAASSATPASAAPGWGGHGWGGHHGHHGHHGWHRGFGIGFYNPTYTASPDCYVVKKVVMTHNGPRVRRVTVCD